MALKDILVHVESDGESADRLAVARSLAIEHGAHVQGLHVATPPAVIAPASVTPPAELLERLRGERDRLAAAAEAAFRAAFEGSEVSTGWSLIEGDVAEVLTRRARRADLLVLGQERGEEGVLDRRGVPDTVVLTAGRPALIVPYVGARLPVGRRVLVAWNGSREAVRAVNDALPLLRRAEAVVILSIDSGGEERGGDLPGAEIARHLARHGVPCEARSARVEDIEVGDVLLSRAADEGADLIVMGAYGRSRFRELVLGGATRHLLAHMTVPVLMSH